MGDALSTVGLSMGHMIITWILLFPHSKMGRRTSQPVDYLGNLFGMCMFFFNNTNVLNVDPVKGAHSKFFVVDPEKISFGSQMISIFFVDSHLEHGKPMKPRRLRFFSVPIPSLPIAKARTMWKKLGISSGLVA
jgi:hypothetical protein